MLPKLDENSTKPFKDNKALHVFIFDDQETTLQKCMDMYGSRTKNNKEYWLFDTTKGIDNRLPLIKGFLRFCMDQFKFNVNSILLRLEKKLEKELQDASLN